MGRQYQAEESFEFLVLSFRPTSLVSGGRGGDNSKLKTKNSKLIKDRARDQRQRYRLTRGALTLSIEAFVGL